MKNKKSIFATVAIAAVALIVSISSCKKDHGNDHDMDMLNINYPAAYIVNGTSNNISVIKLSDNTVTETISLNGATYPHHIYLNPAKTKLAVAITSTDLSGGHAGHGGMLTGLKVQIIDAALIENIGDSYIYAMTLAPDGRHVYIGNGGEKSDGRLRVWNIAEGTVQTANTVIDRFYSNLVLMPGDDFIISVSFERLILFWDQDLTLLHRISLDEAPFNVTGQGRIIEGLAVHPSGTIIAIGSRDGRVRLIGLP